MSLASSTIPVLEPVSYSSPVTEKEVRIIQKPRRLGSRPPLKLPRSTMIGDLKLTALKGRLSTKGIKTEFAGEGVKRVDFLGERTLFCGLKRRAVAGGEVWEMRMRNINQV